MNLNKILNNIEDIEVLIDVNIGQYTTTKLHCMGDIIIIKTPNALINVLSELSKHKIHYHIFRNGLESNY